MGTGNTGGQSVKKPANPSNFKIVKCKNFERGKLFKIKYHLDGSCKYGNTCTFAHGDTDLRAKSENSMPNMSSGFNMNMMQNMFNPMMMDPSMLLMMQQSMGMPMGKRKF